ncbi:MAG TPA: Uma2 family endonuclease [Phycisphaerae bacterium]|nr:Uma2 family endonuclease [Phycisphaerae bacterium]
MTIAEPPSRLKFTRDDYYRMFNMGLFEGQRVELIQGEIIKMSPQNNPHALTCAIVNNWLVKSLSDDFTVRCQLPFVASDDTEPEPDFAVLPGSPQSQQEHPTTALFVIEVAASSLSYDRKKTDIYASRGVPECWILNIPDRQIEVFRQPAAAAESPFGHRYNSSTVFSLEQTVQLLNLPIPPIQVKRLFPSL